MGDRAGGAGSPASGSAEASFGSSADCARHVSTSYEVAWLPNIANVSHSTSFAADGFSCTASPSLAGNDVGTVWDVGASGDVDSARRKCTTWDLA